MLGLFGRAPWSGDATRSALFERFNQQTDMTVAVDDVVVNSNAPESRVFAQMGRALYDRIARAVTGKIRCPHSSALFTVPPTRTHFPSPPSTQGGKISGPMYHRTGSLAHGYPHSSNHASCDSL